MLPKLRESANLLALSMHAGAVRSTPATAAACCHSPPLFSLRPGSHALRVEHAHHDFFDLWSTRLRDLKEFGTGHLLYFHFLQWMALLFLGLFLAVGVPQIALNAMGRWAAAAAEHHMCSGGASA
jgi:hypothetical protein